MNKYRRFSKSALLDYAKKQIREGKLDLLDVDYGTYEISCPDISKNGTILSESTLGKETYAAKLVLKQAVTQSGENR